MRQQEHGTPQRERDGDRDQSWRSSSWLIPPLDSVNLLLSMGYGGSRADKAGALWAAQGTMVLTE